MTEDKPVSTEKTSTFVATETILIDGFPGYHEGSVVAADVVKRHGLEDKVKKA